MLYKISQGQLWIVRIIAIILVIIFFGLASDSYNNGALYFIFGILIAGLYLFYEIGWRNANKNIKKQVIIAKKELVEEEKEYVKRWSWGAMCLGFWWAIFSKIKWYTFLFLIPFANIFFLFYFGKTGKKFSWTKGPWTSFNEFRKRQKILDKIGKILFVFWIIGAISVLSTLLLLQLGEARAKARDAKRIADINQIRSTLELYYDDHNGVYPNDTDSLSGYFVNGQIPEDPLTYKQYSYKVLDSNNRYYINGGVNIRSCASIYCPVIATTNAGYVSGLKPSFNNDWYEWQFHFAETPLKTETGYIGKNLVSVSKTKNAGYHIWAELEKYNKAALSSDDDIVDPIFDANGNLNFAGGVNGANESCTSGDAIDCVYDLGVVPQ